MFECKSPMMQINSLSRRGLDPPQTLVKKVADLFRLEWGSDGCKWTCREWMENPCCNARLFGVSVKKMCGLERSDQAGDYGHTGIETDRERGDEAKTNTQAEAPSAKIKFPFIFFLKGTC